MHIKFASLIICATNDNLTNMSSTLPPEVNKNKDSSVYSTYNFVYSTETFIYWKVKDKIFNLF